MVAYAFNPKANRGSVCLTCCGLIITTLANVCQYYITATITSRTFHQWQYSTSVGGTLQCLHKFHTSLWTGIPKGISLVISRTIVRLRNSSNNSLQIVFLADCTTFYPTQSLLLHLLCSCDRTQMRPNLIYPIKANWLTV